jgi:uncharacterized protein YggU (UPF0235/DUF167 family)
VKPSSSQQVNQIDKLGVSRETGKMSLSFHVKRPAADGPANDWRAARLVARKFYF